MEPGSEGDHEGAAPPQSTDRGERGGRLNILAVLRSSGGLSAGWIVGSAVGAPVSFAVARWLGPESLGRVQFVLLFYFYATLLRTGTFEGGIRSYIHFSAKGEVEAARHSRDVAVTFETIASLIPGLAMLALAFAMHDPTRRLGFLLAPVAVLLASLSSYLGGMFMAEQRFGPVASTNLLRSLVVPGATLVGIPLLGAKAVFLAPMLGDLFAIVSLVVRRPRVELHARFDRATWSPLIRNGFPLGLLGVLYWAYRLVGSTSVALAGSAATYGLYVFALGPVTALAGGIAGIHAVLMPSVWSELATSSPGPAWARDAARMTLVLGVIAGLATNLCQAAFLPLVLLVVPKFHASGPLLEVLAFNVFLLSVGAIPVFVLQSERFNRQVRYLCLWAGFLTLNAAANAISLSLGGGAMSVAVNDIWVQTVALVLTFWLAWAHLGDRAIWRRAVWALAGLAAWSAVLELTVHSMAWTHSGAVSLLGLAAARCSVVVAAWGVLLVVAVRPTPNGLRQAISAAVAR